MTDGFGGADPCRARTFLPTCPRWKPGGWCRKLREEDEEDIFRYASDPEVSRYTTWYSPRSREEARTFLQNMLDRYERQEVAPWGMVDKRTHRVIGTIGFNHWDVRNARAEVGFALARPYWNQGYMSEALRSVVAFGFRQMGLVRIEARCHPDNAASARVMEKAGMIFEGILRRHVYIKGEHQDVKMYAIVRDDFEREYGVPE